MESFQYCEISPYNNPKELELGTLYNYTYNTKASIFRSWAGSCKSHL